MWFSPMDRRNRSIWILENATEQWFVDFIKSNWQKWISLCARERERRRREEIDTEWPLEKLQRGKTAFILRN